MTNYWSHTFNLSLSLTFLHFVYLISRPENCGTGLYKKSDKRFSTCLQTLTSQLLGSMLGYQTSAGLMEIKTMRNVPSLPPPPNQVIILQIARISLIKWKEQS